MTVAPDDVLETLTPEDLSHVDPPADRNVAAMRTLRTVRPALDGAGLSWGPTGSVGFELATAVPTATPESDLDLLLRTSRLTPDVLNRLTALHQRFVGLMARMDCQVETPLGAAALADVVGGQIEIMLRTVKGPRLVSRAVAVS